jgi:large subunit ribosomal protein L25
MAEIVLAAETGRATGSSASRRLRANGKIPAVVYGPSLAATPISVDWRELRGAITTDRSLNVLLTLKIDGKPRQAIVKELQRHPVQRDVLHVDFLEVDPDKPVTADVPIVLEGEATKVTREQGVVEQVLNVLVVTGKPNVIPGHVSADVSELEIGDALTVADIELPPGVTTDADPEQSVAVARVTSLALAEEAAEEGEEVEGEEEEAPAEGEAAAEQAAGESGGESAE